MTGIDLRSGDDVAFVLATVLLSLQVHDDVLRRHDRDIATVLGHVLDGRQLFAAAPALLLGFVELALVIDSRKLALFVRAVSALGRFVGGVFVTRTLLARISKESLVSVSELFLDVCQLDGHLLRDRLPFEQGDTSSEFSQSLSQARVLSKHDPGDFFGRCQVVDRLDVHDLY